MLGYKGVLKILHNLLFRRKALGSRCILGITIVKDCHAFALNGVPSGTY